MQSKWIDGVIEYQVGDVPLLFIAPHKGVEKLEIKINGEKRNFRIGEVGTDQLVKLAAEEVLGSYIVVHVPRLQADFARDPDLLGKGEKFRHNLGGEKIWFTSHKNTDYKKTMDKFHQLIKKINPKFIIDIHNMGSTKADAKLGFGKDKRYINGSDNALKFRDELLTKLDKKMEVLVSKVELTGESEFILNKYESGRLAMLIELSYPRGLQKDGTYNKDFQILIKEIAKLAKKWITKENPQ